MLAPSLHLRLLGHRDSVNCCAVSSQQSHVLASGSEDGRVCLFDLHTGQLTQTLLHPLCHPTPLPKSSAPATCGSNSNAETPEPAQHPDADHPPIAAIAFWPCTASQSSASSAPAHSSPGVLYAASGRDIVCLDPRTGPDPVSRYSHNRDDVAALALSARGSHLAAGDDAGEVLIVDLVAGRPFKHMRSVHPAGMVTSVAFSGRKQWEVVTGGTDSSVARYDYSRARCMDRWPMGQLSQPILAPVVSTRASHTAIPDDCGSAGEFSGSTNPENQSGGADGADDVPTGQLFNPPFVHQLALADPDMSSCSRSGSSGVGCCGQRIQRQLAAVARGDGAIALFDIDTQSSFMLAGGTPVVDAAATKPVKKVKPLPAPVSKGARATGNRTARASRNTHSISGQAATTEAKESDGHETSAGTAHVPGSQTVRRASQGAEPESMPQLQDSPRHPYHHTLLGRSAGGHRRAACCVCFSSIKSGTTSDGACGCPCGLAACGNNLSLLYSAGEDRRVLCWDAAQASAGLGQGDHNLGSAGELISPKLLLWEHQHPRKINDLCVVPWGGQQLQADQLGFACVDGELLVVADTGKRINVYLVARPH